MGFYSLIVDNQSGDVVMIPEHYLVLDTGQNVFNTQIENPDLFVKALREEGVRIVQMNCLDEFESVDPPKQLE
jgi:hypothetical protein